MALLTDYPKYFEELLIEAAQLKRLPINKEAIQTFWKHVKKHSTNKEAITWAVNAVIESGAFLEPGNIIKNIPRTYPEKKEWPEFRDINTTSGIAKDCIALISKKMSGDLTKEQYYQEMVGLHDKYPNAGFMGMAETYRKKIIRM